MLPLLLHFHKILEKHVAVAVAVKRNSKSCRKFFVAVLGQNSSQTQLRKLVNCHSLLLLQPDTRGQGGGLGVFLKRIWRSFIYTTSSHACLYRGDGSCAPCTLFVGCSHRCKNCRQVLKDSLLNRSANWGRLILISFRPLILWLILIPLWLLILWLVWSFHKPKNRSTWRWIGRRKDTQVVFFFK